MHYSMCRNRPIVTIVLLAAFTAQAAVPAQAASPVRMGDWSGAVDLTTSRLSKFALGGSATQLGRFDAYGEVRFAAGRTRGSLVGKGVAVFRADNGDLLVGNVTWNVAPGGDLRASEMRIAWSDSVELSDGSIVDSTGDFEDNQPQELVVIAIIAVLIGLLLPAVQ